MAKMIFEELGGKYERQGDYLIPCIALLWSSIFVTRMANKINFQVMKQSAPDKVCGIHYSCADEHGCM